MFLVEFDHVCPTGGGVLALEIMLDSIREYICFDLRSSLLTLGRARASSALLSHNRSLSLTIFLSILLGTDNDGL